MTFPRNGIVANSHWALLALLGSLTLGSCGRSMTAAMVPVRGTGSAPMSSGAGERVGTRSPSESIAGQVVVTLAPGVNADQLAADHGARVVECELDERQATLVPVPPQTALGLEGALLTDPRAVTAEPNVLLESVEARQQSFAFDDGFSMSAGMTEQPAIAAIGLSSAHDVALGRGVIVAIIDTGIDPRHPLLRNAYMGGIDFVDHDSDPSEGANGIDDDGDGNIDEAFGHGTHIAGIVHMVAPEAKLLSVRVLDSDGRGDLQAVSAGVRWAVARGAKVINLSLGSLGRADALQKALEEAEAAGVIVIASAGNWGAETPVEFPARSEHVAAIAAVDANAVPATFSSYGHIVALAAPGVAVRSTYPGNRYRLWSGTSMATPFVSGTVALLCEIHPTWTLTQVLDRIGDTARPINDGYSEFGAGALDAGAALAPDRRSRIDDVPAAEDIRPRGR